MLVPDVNVLLNVAITASPHHPAALRWLESAGNGPEPVGLPTTIRASFVRVITGTGMGTNQKSVPEAFAFCERLERMPAFLALTEGRDHWDHFQRIVVASGISGKDISDAYLAAFAIENDATFVTFDRGFARFPGVRVFVPE